MVCSRAEQRQAWQEGEKQRQWCGRRPRGLFVARAGCWGLKCSGNHCRIRQKDAVMVPPVWKMNVDLMGSVFFVK